jgi:hypothetical protein
LKSKIWKRQILPNELKIENKFNNSNLRPIKNSNIKLILELLNNIWNDYKPYPKTMANLKISINDVTQWFLMWWISTFRKHKKGHQNQQNIFIIQNNNKNYSK